MEEIVVDPHNATWHTVGEKGAEFVDLPKDAIVFNHLQSRSLLNNGYALGRGRTMANGSALAEGTAYAKGGGKALEKFQNWFEKLFDWIEIRLERQTKKIERFTKRADLNIERGNYDKAASQYSSAITASLTQIGNESIASNRYQSKANSVLNQAVKRKLISKKAAKNIRKGVANGKLNISSYGKKMQEVIKDYQEFYDKAQDAKDAVDELRESIYDYIKSLKDLRDAQRDAKIDLAESLSTIATSGSNATGAFAMSQLAARNELLLSQQSAYDENVTSIESDFAAQEDKAANSAGKKASKAYKTKNAKKRKYKGKKLSKKQLKAYRNAIKKAQNCIKEKTAIASGTLKTIRKYNPSLYVSFVSYNEGLTTSKDIQKILEDTRLEAAVNYAETSAEIFQNMLDMTEAQNDQADSRIDVLSKQADAATGFTAKNSLLDQASTYYSAIVDNDRELVNRLSDSVNSYISSVSDMSGVTSKLKKLSNNNKTRKAVEQYIEAAKSAVNSRKEISASIITKLAEYVSKGYVSMAFYQACYNYNMALTSYNEAQAQLEIDEATAKIEQAALGRQKFENVQQEFTNEQNTITADMDLLQAQQDLKTTRGLSLSSYDYGSLIGNSMRLQDSYTREISALNEVIADNLAKGLWTTSSQEYIDATNAVSDYRTKIQECAKDQEEYNNAIAQLPYDVLDKALARLDSIEKYYESILDLNEQLGRDSSEQDYTNQIDANLSKLADLESEANQAYRDWQKALSSSDRVYGGKTADEWETAYMGYKADVNSLQADIDKLRDALRDDVYWRSFERAHKAAEKLSDTLNGLSNLIDDDMLFDREHNFTDYGITRVALLAKQFEATRDEVGNYANDIKNLNNLYAQGMYTQEEYFDKQAELQKNLLSSASDMKGYINEIREMYKDIDQAELDALKKLVDSRNKALSAKKSYYDYDKTIKDKTKDIQELTAQIAALEGIGTAEAKASMARLQEQLVEAQEDLAETRRDHYFDLSSDALDEMQDILSEEFDEKWEKLGVNLEDMKQLLADAKTIQEDNAALVSKSLEKLLAFYGVSGIQTHFASGTRRVGSSLVGLSNEAGSELLVTKNGIISHFNPGDGVVPSALTQRLYQMASGRMPINANGTFGAASVNQHYDNLINIEGNVDRSVVEELKRFSQDFLEQSYNYTTERIKKDFVRTGGTRRI